MEWGETPRESVTVKPSPASCRKRDKSDTWAAWQFFRRNRKDAFLFSASPYLRGGRVRPVVFGRGAFFVFPPVPMGRRRETIDFPFSIGSYENPRGAQVSRPPGRPLGFRICIHRFLSSVSYLPAPRTSWRLIVRFQDSSARREGRYSRWNCPTRGTSFSTP